MSIDAAFTTFPSLTTDRLRLREIRATDAETLFSLKSDPEVTTSYGQEPHSSLEDTKAWIQRLQDAYARRDGLAWCITFKEQDLALGTCLFYNFDTDFKCGELGYELMRVHWRKGIMGEALPAAITFGFNELGLHRIEANPLEHNASSAGLIVKLGFRLDGRLRQRAFFRGQYLDQLYYGLLEDEWPRKRGNAPSGYIRRPIFTSIW